MVQKESCQTIMLELKINTKLHPDLKSISGRVNRASATETVDSSSILGGVKPKTKKSVFKLSYLTFSIKRGPVKPPPCAVDTWQFDSDTARSLKPSPCAVDTWQFDSNMARSLCSAVCGRHVAV